MLGLLSIRRGETELLSVSEDRSGSDTRQTDGEECILFSCFFAPTFPEVNDCLETAGKGWSHPQKPGPQDQVPQVPHTTRPLLCFEGMLYMEQGSALQLPTAPASLQRKGSFLLWKTGRTKKEVSLQNSSGKTSFLSSWGGPFGGAVNGSFWLGRHRGAPGAPSAQQAPGGLLFNVPMSSHLWEELLDALPHKSPLQTGKDTHLFFF